MAGERKDIRRRIAAVLRDELDASGWEIFHYFNVIGEGQKYVKVRTSSTAYGWESAQFERSVLQVSIIAITAYRTEGFDGEIEDLHDDMIDEVRTALYRAFCEGVSGQWLISTEYTTAPTYLDHRIGAALVSDLGAITRQDSGIDQISLATEFILEVPILQEVG